MTSVGATGGTTVASDGTTQTGSIDTTFGGSTWRDAIYIGVYSSGWSGTITAETGDWYVKLTNVEIIGGPTPDGLSTTAEEVINSVVDLFEDGAGSGGWIAEFPGSQHTGADLTDYTFADRFPGDIIRDLAAIPDANGDLYDAAVWHDRELVFEPAGTSAKRWSIDVSDYELTFDHDTVTNKTYVIFKDTTVGSIRTDLNEDLNSTAWLGYARYGSFESDTTSSTTADTESDGYLAAFAGGEMMASFVIKHVYTEVGGHAYPWDVRANDVVIVNNLPAMFAEELSEFTVGRTSFNLVTGTLTIEFIQPLPTITNLLSSR